MIVAVISGGVLLVPAACALLQRSGSSQSQNLKELLMPNLQLDKSLYNPYSVGLTMLLVAVLLAGIVCRERSGAGGISGLRGTSCSFCICLGI